MSLLCALKHLSLITMGSGERREVDIREETGVSGKLMPTGKHPCHKQQRQHHITSHATFSHKFFPALHGNVDNTSLVVVDIKHSRKINRGSPAAP